MRDHIIEAIIALEIACIASCNCMTKTDKPQAHKKSCRFRRYREAIDGLREIQCKKDPHSCSRVRCHVPNSCADNRGDFLYPPSGDENEPPSRP